LFPGNLRDVCCRFNAKHRNSSGLKVLEQISVVACNLDDLAVSAELETLDHHFTVALCVLDPARRNAGEIRIVAKDCVGRLELFKL
jgi:hypothetical protein